MADERPFEATPAKMQAARRSGDIPRSQELLVVLGLCGGIAGCACAVPALGVAFAGMIHGAALGNVDRSQLLVMYSTMLTPGLLSCAAVVCGAVLQSQGLRFVAIRANLQRLSVAQNIGRVWSRETVFAVVRGSAAFVVAIAVLIPMFAQMIGQLLRTTQLTPIARIAWNGALHAAETACTMVVFAAADYGVQFVGWRSRLRMTFDEVKRDHKEHEGDPVARGRRKALHRSIVRGSLRRLPAASFVVTNPTHIAVALEYRPPEVPVPKVVVRAADELAARVRELAAQLHIPVVENVELARALYSLSQAGDVIAPALYIAVAEIVAALHAKGGRE